MQTEIKLWITGQERKMHMFEFDPHTHTIASGHAYSTIKEMAQAASQKGIETLQEDQ